MAGARRRIGIGLAARLGVLTAVVQACSSTPVPFADLDRGNASTASDPLPEAGADRPPVPAPRTDAGPGDRMGPDASDGDILPVEEPCREDGTVFFVRAESVGEYLIDGIADPRLYLCRGRTYTFRLDARFHPFLVKSQPTAGADDTYSEGVTNNGAQVGDVVLRVAASAPSSLFYVCEAHPLMLGELAIRDP